ncbi:hypothetical protein SELMODRAFT_169057 [Selaginella moellendorffii]|uniref:TMEM205-like domain-containing protein n=1 Tax=Selaginella moellendorffii TaxID=88036 RepID=D8R8J0_SELML|nr:transmembrane protein 205 [Selaginella moellendorffii]EFJ32072.1 hypothetical protein SELMODRAFT_169057 [Selaginella moellendorffii]|eukprot:XP_002967473.1 transmembrane protein 205 [Selaginella moellendorffii]
MWITRFLSVLGFLALGLALSPLGDHLRGWAAGKNAAAGGGALAVRMVHLLGFATAWGTSLWVTFIGGIIMFKHLPRHQFGNLQSKLFPVYFEMLAVCSTACIGAFSLLHPWGSSTSAEKMQLGALVFSLMATLLNLLVFEPMTIKTMKERHKIEREESIGEEVGLSKNKEAAKRNPALAKINKKFGMVHGLSSLANLFCFGGFAVHSWYLAGKLAL